MTDFDLRIAYEAVADLDVTAEQKTVILHWLTGVMITSGFPAAAVIRKKIVEVRG